MISLYGGKRTGGILKGFPKGIKVNMRYIEIFINLRKGGKDYSAEIQDEDIPQIKQGIIDGVTTGEDIIVEFNNKDINQEDYDIIKSIYRPSHTEYVSMAKFGKIADLRGGGSFSSRLMLPLVFFGALCHQVLNTMGVKIASHIVQIDQCYDKQFDANIDDVLIDELNRMPFATIDEDAKKEMLKCISDVKAEGDSVGGIIESAVTHLPAGIGGMHFDSLESKISRYLFGIPAVKGVSFGKGFEFVDMHGSEANDCYALKDNKVITTTNNNGGILGGLANGMPILINTVFKPAPSISMEQYTLNFETKEVVPLNLKGHYDTCVVPKANIIVTSAISVAILEAIFEGKQD